MFSVNVAFSQANLLNANSPEEIGQKTDQQLAADNDKPLAYGYVGDRDLLWSKVVWEYIDLNERINLPFYYPIHDNSTSGTRKSLFKTLMDGIQDGDITQVYDDSYFTAKLTPKEIEAVHNLGITKIYSPEDGMSLGLAGIIDDMITKATHSTILKCDFNKMNQGTLEYK